MKVLGSLLLTFLIIATVQCEEEEKGKTWKILSDCKEKAHISKEDFKKAMKDPKDVNNPKAEEACACFLKAKGLATGDKPDMQKISEALDKKINDSAKKEQIKNCLKNAPTDKACPTISCWFKHGKKQSS